MCNHLHGDEITQMMCSIEDAVKQTIKDSDVNVVDPLGNGHHFEVSVTSSEFEGKNRVEQHRLVMDSLKELLGADLHAVIIKTQIK